MTQEAPGDLAVQKLRTFIAEKASKLRPGSPERYRLLETLELSDEALIDKIYSHVEPNPDRIGCAPRAVLLAWSQCVERYISPRPMATYPKWRELGRHVRKGEKAITLCQPVTVKRPADTADTNEPGVFTRFIYRPHWFVLAQTDGAEIPSAPMPTWDAARALPALDVIEVPFDATNGNVLGFARGRTIAVSPINPMPHKTRFHELAHVLLGHTAEGEQADGELTPRSLKECEAEAVALLCCAALELPDVEQCRGYIQAWWGAGNPIPERSAQRVLKAADQILRAGREQARDQEAG